MGALRSEWYEFVDDPEPFLATLKKRRPVPDLFTFVQRLTAVPPRHSQYYWEPEEVAVLPIQSFDHWWKKQLNDKTRNMIRKAAKKGVSILPSQIDDRLVRGIQDIYNESPLRQGREFKHFGKSLDRIREEHSSFLDRSEFFGAYHDGHLVGFIKLVFQGEWASLMNIISKVSARDKAPTNALISAAVERCAAKGIGLLQYGSWSRRSFGDFKLHHGFQQLAVPRYFVPLTRTGRLMLRLGLQKPLQDRLPPDLADRLTYLRTRFYQFKYRNWSPRTAPATAGAAPSPG